MIDSGSISAARVLRPVLTVVGRNIRQRDVIDSRRNYLIVKRFLDILFSLAFILCILSWLLPIMAILIKCSSRGPVFFVQKRIGLGGKSFSCLKFRTMVLNAEADTMQASENDKRITKVGFFLRKLNIDEFPQFFNVLKGDMSVVGPRPHMYADCAKFASVLPGYKFRNMVKPGITGLAQVKGYHGPALSRNSILLRYHWDNYYIRNMCFSIDIAIICKTALQRIAAFFHVFPEPAPLQKISTDSRLYNS